MPESNSELTRQRFQQLLNDLAERGLTQREIAERVNIPPQYVSNLKTGHREMKELVARRFGTVFGYNYEWLLGNSDKRNAPTIASTIAPTPTESLSRKFPALDLLIEGDPQANERWDGTFAELSGAAAVRVRSCRTPYVLKCTIDDLQGRIRQRDLLLISQEAREDAEIHVVRHRKRLVLARAGAEGRYQRVSDGQELAAECTVVAHCVGIVWASLVGS